MLQRFMHVLVTAVALVTDRTQVVKERNGIFILFHFMSPPPPSANSPRYGVPSRARSFPTSSTGSYSRGVRHSAEGSNRIATLWKLRQRSPAPSNHRRPHLPPLATCAQRSRCRC